MSYIKKERREHLRVGLRVLAQQMEDMELTKGDLNYICYAIGQFYIQKKGPSYQNISDAVDGIRGAGEELKRRVQDPYEDQKIVENGDI